jgi:Phosphodiester glycosidase
VRQHHRKAQRGLAALLASLVAAVVIPLSVVGPVAVHAELRAPIRRNFNLGPGVRLTTIRYATPNEVRVLTITQGAGSVFDLFPAVPKYPGYKKPSVIANANGAIALVNGDFAQGGRPKHISMIDGELWTSGIQAGSLIGVSSDGSRGYAGHTTIAMTAKRPGTSIRIARWNAGVPKAAQVNGFSLRGGTVEPPPGTNSPTATDPFYCEARLVPNGPFEWSGAGKTGLTRSYVVDVQPEPCDKGRTPLGADAGAVVLAGVGGEVGGDAIKGLEPAMAIRLNWSFPGWPAVVDAVGAQPMLVEDGVNVAPPFHVGDSYFLNYNPRTAVGFSASCGDADTATLCKTFIMTVDGRATASTWSKGMRLPELADEFIRLGARWAANLDGGGGTEMWVAKRDPAYCVTNIAAGGCLITKPADGGERPAVMGVAARLAPDTGEPPPIRG